MALQPLWLQEVDYPARWDRILFDNIWTAGTLGPSALEVTPSSPAAMTVDVSAGVAVIAGTDQSFQGKYLVREENPTTGLTIAAAPGSGQRNDLIVVQVRDTNAGGASGDDAVIVVVPGTPSGSPVDPTPPASSLVLARVRVPAGTGSITSGLIDDLRAEATAAYDGLGAPAGTIMDTIAATAPSGWALLDGSTLIGAQTAYPRLWAVMPAAFKSGSDIVLPDMRGRVSVMQDSGTFSTIGGTGGSETHTLTTNEMPSHTHTQNSHNHTQNAHTHTQDSHNHTQSAHNHTQNAHTHTQNAHTHTQNSHNHLQASHDHGTDRIDTTFRYKAGTTGDPEQYTIEPSETTDARTAVNLAATATNQNATATNQNATATNNSTTATNVATTATNQNTTAVNVATTATNQNTGGGTAHNNLQPYLVVNKIIRLG